MTFVTTPAGVELCYETFGDAGLPPLVLIQGLGAQMIGWRSEFCQRLADAGFEVIRFDNRDIGLSQQFPDGYTIADMAEDTHGLLVALGIDPAHIVGQSMGGMIAQQLTIDHPESVRSLGLVYTAPSKAYFAGVELVDERLELPRPQNRAEAIDFYLANEEPCLSPGYTPDLDWIRELGGQMWDRGFDHDAILRQYAAVIAADDRTDALRTIAVPTTILHGDGDRLINVEASKAMHEAIPGSRLTILPGMGHEVHRALWAQIIGELTANAVSAGR